jgi:colicin import membrane protein
MESSSDQFRAFALSVLFHLGLVALFWFGAMFMMPMTDEVAAGEPIQATLQVSQADLDRVQAAIKASKPAPVAPEEATPPPQPRPEPAPQTSEIPPQPVAQAPQDRPDTVHQERIARIAQEKAEHEALELEESRRQEQVDLTEDVTRQQLAERRQRLREEYEAITREREAAARRTRLEEQKLQQLADLKAASRPAPEAPAPAAPAGDRGVDEGLLARYKAAMLQTADQNWNHIGAPELTHCRVRFTQIPGGEVINVEFMSCPYDSQGREFVDRALRKAPMPYSGFEEVFLRKVELTFCYPREECTR